MTYSEMMVGRARSEQLRNEAMQGRQAHHIQRRRLVGWLRQLAARLERAS